MTKQLRCNEWLSPSRHLEWERERVIMTGGELLKNDLVNLTLPGRNFFLLPIRKIDDQVI